FRARGPSAPGRAHAGRGLHISVRGRQWTVARTLSSRTVARINLFAAPVRTRLGRTKASEFIGELGAAAVLYFTRFIDSGMKGHDRWAPDFLAMHAVTGTWGIFEAKGGESKLGRSKLVRGHDGRERMPPDRHGP